MSLTSNRMSPNNLLRAVKGRTALRYRLASVAGGVFTSKFYLPSFKPRSKWSLIRLEARASILGIRICASLCSGADFGMDFK